MPSCHPFPIRSSRLPPLLRPARFWKAPLSVTRFRTTTNEAGLGSDSEQRKPASTSRRRVKRGRETPSRIVIEALKLVGKVAVLPYSETRKSQHQKIDLSYEHPDSSRRGPIRSFRVRTTTRLDRKPRLQSILASFIIQNFSHDHQPVLNDCSGGKDALDGPPINTLGQHSQVQLSEEQSKVLLSRGYDYNDVKSWGTIICEENIHVATKEFLRFTRSLSPHDDAAEKPLPAFVPLLYARRSNMNNEGLRCLLIYLWQEIRRKKSRMISQAAEADKVESTHPKHDYPLLDDSSILVLIVRLLRHARATWPDALVTITRMFIECFGDIKQPLRTARSSRRSSKNSRITFLMNRILVLLAIPSNVSSYRVVAHHQRAQFDLLQVMAHHSPPLVITRSAYRAIISVQLRNKKTDQERDWDNLKAKSWPPWKQEKTGLDAVKGLAYGTSRALEVLNRSREAGYGGAATWDKVATILSGWDIDGSPTTQSRSLLLHEIVSREVVARDRRSSRDRAPWNVIRDHKLVWAARIRTTRTVHEAWACFLAYSDCGLPPEKHIYLAMLEKLAYENRRLRSTLDEKGSNDAPGFSGPALNAGDGKELSAPPSSPKESTYVRIQPPSFHDLAVEMFQNSIIPIGPDICFLLKHAETLGQGMVYLNWAKLKTPSIESLTDTQFDNNREQLSDVPPALFGSFMGLLCRFPVGDMLSTKPSHQEEPNLRMPLRRSSIQGISPLTLACRLLKIRHPLYRPAWHRVFTVLSTPRNRQDSRVEEGSSEYLSCQALQRWTLLQDLLKDMTSSGLGLDSETLRLICRGLESATLAAMVIISKPAYQHSENPETGTTELQPDTTNGKILHDRELITQASNVLKTGSHYIHSAFHEAMGTGNYLIPSHVLKGTSTMIPRLFTTPEGAFLHRYIRTLGLLREWQGILDTVRWMKKYEQEIGEGMAMARSGPNLIRKTLVAVKAFLEGSWIYHDNITAQMTEGNVQSLMAEYSAPYRIKEAVQRLVHSVEAWGGWPSDEEVSKYCTASNAQFPSVHILLQIVDQKIT